MWITVDKSFIKLLQIIQQVVNFKKIVFSIILQCLFGIGSVEYMRLHRFYVSQPLGEDVVINDVPTIKQWIKVFRYTQGDFVILFNGEGSDVTYQLSSVSPSSCHLIRTKQSPSIIPKRNVTLYLSVIKKDLFELVVQKATELGISTIVPVITERAEKKNLNLSRLETIAREALEQCGRGDRVTILPIQNLQTILQNKSKNDICYVLQMGGFGIQDVVHTLSKESVGLFIGPEGGWSPAEVEIFATNNIRALSLGLTTLRAETAAIVACAYTCA